MHNIMEDYVTLSHKLCLIVSKKNFQLTNLIPFSFSINITFEAMTTPTENKLTFVTVDRVNTAKHIQTDKIDKGESDRRKGKLFV